MQDAAEVRFLLLPRSNVKGPLAPCLVYLAHTGKQRVETTFGIMNRQMPKTIYTVSPAGFLFKLQAAIIAYAFDILMA